MAADPSPNPHSDLLDELEPLSRALLDLSLKRGMSDADIADVLGTDAEAVLENRVALMRSLADQVAPESASADLPELEALIVARIYGTANGSATPPPGADAPAEPGLEIIDDRPTGMHSVVEAPQPESVVDEPQQEPPAAGEPRPAAPAAPARKRPSPLWVAVPLLLLGALIGVVIALANRGDDNGSAPAKPAPAPQAKPLAPQRVALAPLPGHQGRGTASFQGDRLRLTVRGLPDPRGGAYDVWLYNSIADAQRVGELQSTNGTVNARLPGNWQDYRYVDVSLEPPDRNPNHSGQSVLRAPVPKP
jgi:hypothetical protein